MSPPPHFLIIPRFPQFHDVEFVELLRSVLIDQGFAIVHAHVSKLRTRLAPTACILPTQSAQTAPIHPRDYQLTGNALW
jgi:hypothetical protein